MLSVAEVPLWGLTITGCIGLVWLEGRLYRLATYRGARVVQVEEHCAEVRQGRLRLKVTALDRQSQPLLAPHQGAWPDYPREPDRYGAVSVVRRPPGAPEPDQQPGQL